MIAVETLICDAIFAVLGSQATLWRVKMRTLVPGQGVRPDLHSKNIFRSFSLVLTHGP